MLVMTYLMNGINKTRKFESKLLQAKDNLTNQLRSQTHFVEIFLQHISDKFIIAKFDNADKYNISAYYISDNCQSIGFLSCFSR
jgi:hypothetical protein